MRGLLFGLAARELEGRLQPVLESTRDVDLIVHHVIDVAAFAAAKVHGKRRVSAALAPGLWNNRRVFATGRSLGLPLNLALGAMLRRLFPRFTDQAFRPVIAAAGLRAPTKQIILEAADSPVMNFLAVSPEMVAPDPAWPGSRRQTGYWYLDVPGYEPPEALRAFVEAGEPPLAIGFGSMVGMDVRFQTEVIAGAVQRLGRRAVLLSGWGELGKGELPPSLHVADHVPHDWLFPRVSLVVHHGGAGTTAAAARAGVPQAVVWHMGDQSTWGGLVKRRGLGPAPPHHQKLSVERLVALIAEADRVAVREAARAMGERIPRRGRAGRGGAGDWRAGVLSARPGPRWSSKSAGAMTTEPTVLSAREGAVLTLTLNRPSRLNALDFALLDALLRELPGRGAGWVHASGRVDRDGARVLLGRRPARGGGRAPVAAQHLLLLAGLAVPPLRPGDPVDGEAGHRGGERGGGGGRLLAVAGVRPAGNGVVGDDAAGVHHRRTGVRRRKQLHAPPADWAVEVAGVGDAG